MDILFLSISMGAGHLKASEALNEYTKKIYPHSRTMVVDTFKYISPIAHMVIVDGYLNIIKINPKIYGNLYRMSECGNKMNVLSKIIGMILSKKLERLIAEFKPSLIVCTHPFPLQMVSYLKMKNKIEIPSIAVFTDYVNHPLWHHNNIEAFIVGHEYIKKDMVKKGILQRRIFSYGIPVSPEFLKREDKKVVRKHLALEDKFTVLIMGGSLGFGDIYKAFRSLLLNFKDSIQIIVVTGKNVSLKNKLETINLQNKSSILVLGYTENISALMDASDVILTKPGGMTISEALVKRLPMMVISSIPGQEERNADFLIKNGVAIKISGTNSLCNTLYQILDNPYILSNMRDKCAQLARIDSGHKIVTLMEHVIKKA